MGRLPGVALLAAALCLVACSRQSGEVAGDSHHGRYVGIGTYAVGDLWARMAVTDPPKDDRAATIDDDEHIIVVVDSDTGEIRECGDYSGRCVSMNPWTKAIAGPSGAPVTLTKHAAEVRAEEEEANKRGADRAPPPAGRAASPKADHSTT